MLRSFLLIILAVSVLSARAQTARILPQHDMEQWGIPAGNYSGITPLGAGRYALISDKQEADGWQEVEIDFTPTGDIRRMAYLGAHYDADTQGHARDAEGIVATNPSTSSGQARTLFVSAESDQRIVEMDSDGLATGRELLVPEWASSANTFGNYGFEALAYNERTQKFWTTTEQGLRSDVERPTTFSHAVPTLHRILRFGNNMNYEANYAYRTDAPIVSRKPRLYAFGIPEMTVLDDSTLLIMEREIAVPQGFDGSFVHNRIYAVRPSADFIAPEQTPLRTLSDAAFLPKRLIAEFTTRLKIFGRKNMANYEGMCLGPTLADGRRTLILVADSQNRQGNRLFRLKDYIRVIVL